MREIKFRGCRTLNGEWVYGNLMIRRECSPVTETETTELYTAYYIVPFDGLDYYEDEVNPSTIGEYTGLKDHHGKEIYEGDIVRATSLSISTLGAFRDTIVKYNSDAGAYILVCGNRSSYLYVMAEHVLEIIGNIHENPEMIKQ